MTTRIEVQSSLTKDNEIHFSCNSEELSSDVELTPSEQVLVDSDSLSFIYILETKTSFIYVSFPIKYWHNLKEVRNKDKEAVLHLTNHKELRMKGMKDELEYLVDNIKENANYGSEMMESVERIFYES